MRDGGLLIQNGRITEVGSADVLASLNPAIQRTHFPDCIITPGLVNAHTHLSLTALEGLLPPGHFHEWLAEIPKAVNALDETDIAHSASLGAVHCLLSGTTVVGDIAYGPEAPSAAVDAGLAGTFYWEVLGVDGSRLAQRLHDDDFPDSPPASCMGRARCGISPHAPYTSGPSLLQATHEFAREHHSAFAIHIAESPAEVELLRDGTGPLSPLAAKLARGFSAPGMSPIRYLDSLGVLDNAAAIHCVHVPSVDIRLLAAKARGVVLCPRSNEYLHTGNAPVSRILAAGARVGLGTDSSASNTNLDLLEEARALKRLAPDLTAERLLRILSIEGAEVLGLEDVFGSLEPGKQADVAVWQIPGSNSPTEDLLRRGGRSCVRAVLTAGTWRIRDGQPVFPVRNIELAVSRATQKAADALKSEQPKPNA